MSWVVSYCIFKLFLWVKISYCNFKLKQFKMLKSEIVKSIFQHFLGKEQNSKSSKMLGKGFHYFTIYNGGMFLGKNTML